MFTAQLLTVTILLSLSGVVLSKAHRGPRVLTETEVYIQAKVMNALQGGHSHSSAGRVTVTPMGRLSPSCRAVGYSVCCVEDEVIDLPALGVPQALLPVSFVAGRCAGSCPARNALLEDAGEDAAGSSCAPSGYSTLVLTYEDGDEAIKTISIADAIVSRCSCGH